MIESVLKLKKNFSLVAGQLDWAPALLSRITIGFVFIQSGWGKLHHLDKVIDFFASIGIPAPQIQAPFVSGVELGCGSLVLLGLCTRLAAIPLIGTMVVAIVTVKMDEAATISDFLGFAEYLYIVLLVWLIVKGAGKLSLDALLFKE